jgi:GMP synthase-like glutamine amidotransferase
VACQNQAFALGPRAVGLQFHLETTPESARALIDHCPGDLVAGRYVQRVAEIVPQPARFATINYLMTKLLDHLARSGD